MFSNMASSLIRSVRVNEDAVGNPAVPGRIITTLEKAKELRPFVEKLITLACKASVHEERAEEFATSAEPGSDAWRNWRTSSQWNQWNQAIAPAVAKRRRAFAILRDKEAVDILFDELVARFRDRDGGYTRVVRLAKPRLGDSGVRALIEFVGENDRIRSKRKAPVIADEDEANDETPQHEAEETVAETEATAPEAQTQLDDDATKQPEEGTGSDVKDEQASSEEN